MYFRAEGVKNKVEDKFHRHGRRFKYFIMTCFAFTPQVSRVKAMVL